MLNCQYIGNKVATQRNLKLKEELVPSRTQSTPADYAHLVLHELLPNCVILLAHPPDYCKFY